MPDEFGMRLSDFHTSRERMNFRKQQEIQAVVKTRKGPTPEVAANIIIAAENLREAMKTTEQSETFRFVLRALAALDKELSR